MFRLFLILIIVLGLATFLMIHVMRKYIAPKQREKRDRAIEEENKRLDELLTNIKNEKGI